MRIADHDLSCHYLLFKLFFLVFERLLNLVHQASLFEQSGRGADTVQLQRRWQLDLLVINHSTFLSLTFK